MCDSLKFRRFAALLVMSALLAAPAALSALTCQAQAAQAKAWIENASQLPRTADELRSVPQELRRTVVSLLPAEVRSDLWRESMRTYLADHPGLSRAQARLIRNAIDLATPEYFSLKPGDFGWADLVERPTLALAEQGQALFRPEVYQTVFLDMNHALASDTADPVAAPIAIPACDCNIGSGNCNLNGHVGPCQANPTGCLTSPNRCGPMNNLNCDGNCNFAAQPVGTDTKDGTLKSN